jgi:hypothetical protein
MTRQIRFGAFVVGRAKSYAPGRAREGTQRESDPAVGLNEKWRQQIEVIFRQ